MTARAALAALALALVLPGCHARKTAAEIPARAPAAPVSISNDSTRGASREVPTEAEASSGATSSSAAALSPSGAGASAGASGASPGGSAPASTATAAGGGAAGFAWGESRTAPADVPVPDDDAPNREARSRTALDADDDDDGGDAAPSAADDDPGDDAPPAFPAAVWAVARPAAVLRGATVEIDLHIADARDVLGVPCHLVFDPAVLAFREAREGSFLRDSSGRGTAFLAAPVEAGRVALGLSLLGPGSGATGEGLLATLVFEAVGEGATRVEFERARLASGRTEEASARFSGALVVVSGTMLPSR